MDGYNTTTTVQARKATEKKRKYQMRKLDTEQYIVTRKIASKRALGKIHLGKMMMRCNWEAH